MCGQIFARCDTGFKSTNCTYRNRCSYGFLCTLMSTYPCSGGAGPRERKLSSAEGTASDTKLARRTPSIITSNHISNGRQTELTRQAISNGGETKLAKQRWRHHLRYIQPHQQLSSAGGEPVLIDISILLLLGRRSRPSAYADRNESLADLAFLTCQQACQAAAFLASGKARHSVTCHWSGEGACAGAAGPD